MNQKEKHFLSQKYPDLPRSPEVESAVKRKEKRTEKKISGDINVRIETYLSRLEEIFKHPEESVRERRIDILKDKLLDLYIIKPEEVPESYFELQKRIAREQGYGDIEISDELRKETIKTIIDDQTKSLDIWIDYLGSPDTLYPSWFKYFTFRNIVKLGEYDKEKKEFRKRSKGTTATFPDLNREALSYVYDSLNKSYYQKEKVNDQELQKLLDSANFAKLYAYAIERITPASQEQKEVIKGEWIKYNKGSDPTPLWKSLQGHGTGWCTAGESTAEAQLELGDFYAYYTLDLEGKNTIPRIAIRMQENEIAEIRGINKEQNLEPNMLDITRGKMETLPGAQKYEKKTADMKKLTETEKKANKGEELSKQELEFLYEIKFQINGFGWQEDPRIQEIKEKRNQKQDYATIFDCSLDHITLDKTELKKHTRVYVGDLDKSSLDYLEQLGHPLFISRYLYLGGCTSLKSLPENLSVGRSLDLGGCTSLKSLPENLSVGVGLSLRGCTSLKSLPENLSVGRYLDLKGCTSLEKIPDNIYEMVKGEIYNIPAHLKSRFKKLEKKTRKGNL